MPADARTSRSSLTYFGHSRATEVEFSRIKSLERAWTFPEPLDGIGLRGKSRLGSESMSQETKVKRCA